jgi:uncharacterized protein (DUF305 family)
VAVPSRPQLVALAAALLFLAGCVGYVAGSRTDDAGGDAEVGFLLDMIAHHEQAIEMSRTALAGSMPEGVESFAIEVVADQQYEVGKMETLLEEWGHPRQRDDDERTMGWMGEPVPLERMPGLASDGDLDRLGAARGDDAGALWLALMSNHHRGGVHMAEAAIARVEDRRVRALAERMARIQAVEVNEYESARRRLGLEVPIGLGSVPVPVGKSDGGHGH